MSVACWNCTAGTRAILPRAATAGSTTVLSVAARAADPLPAKVIYLTPQGPPLKQAKVRELATRERMILLCGRYEGIDERLIEAEVDEEISIGDYVLSGGELAAAGSPPDST